jgi:hypothetical protein
MGDNKKVVRRRPPKNVIPFPEVGPVDGNTGAPDDYDLPGGYYPPLPDPETTKDDFILTLLVLEDALHALRYEIRAGHVGEQGTADRLGVVSDETHRLSELAQDGKVEGL